MGGCKRKSLGFLINKRSDGLSEELRPEKPEGAGRKDE